MKNEVIVIGAGPAGLMAAIQAAKNSDNNVTIIEKNEKIGKKLFITGKGRCNITNASDLDNIFSNIVTNKKFLYSAFYTFTNDQVIDFFEELGLRTKVERGNRVFPVSDKSSDVISFLSNELKRLSINLVLKTKVERINISDKEKKVQSVTLDNKNTIKADKIIVATGGNSYQTTGSNGDGYKLLKDLGHTINDIYPALVPLEVKEDNIKQLQGLSLKNIEASLIIGKKVVYKEFGEMLFTHFGVSGPALLSGSSYITKDLAKGNLVKLSIDLKPALTTKQLDDRILRDFSELTNKDYKNSLDKLLPKKLIPIVIERSEINPNKKVNEITKEERRQLIETIKNFSFTISKTRGFNEAIITKGGINVNEINPANMESKIVSGLFVIGELLDIDALTGGYNLQVAWSTGYLAGISV